MNLSNSTSKLITSNETDKKSISKIEKNPKNIFEFFREDLKILLLSKVFLMLLFIKIRFSISTIFYSIIVSNLTNIIIQLNTHWLQAILNNKYSLKIIVSIFFLILGIKYILDNTRFSIREQASKDIENCNKCKNNNKNLVENNFSEKENNKKNSYNGKLGINNSSNELINTTTENSRNNNLYVKFHSNKNNSFPSNSKADSDRIRRNSEMIHSEEDEHEKSFIFNNKYDADHFQKQRFCGLNLNNFLVGIENTLLSIIIIFSASLLDNKSLFLKAEVLVKALNPLFAKEDNLNYDFPKEEFIGNIISCVFGLIIIFCLDALFKKTLGKKRTIFIYGFLILIYFGIYSLYYSVSNNKSYHVRKIMLSNRIEKDNPNVFLKKKNLELHFIVNNSKLVKNKATEVKTNQEKLNK